MKSINIFVWLSAISISPLAHGITVEEAAKKGLIKLTIKSKGGHVGNVIEMNIKNLTSKSWPMNLEAGRKLDSKNNEEQDILIVKSEEFILKPNEQKKLEVYGMCCQAHNDSPTKENQYTIGKMADTTLIKLAKFIDSSKYHSSYTAQQAVWTISDNESIAMISGGNNDEASALQKYVSKVTGRPIPKYSISYRNGANDGGVLGRASRIDAIFGYTLADNAKVAMAIYDASGKLVQTVMADKFHEKGEYKLYYTFKTYSLPRGTYYARLTENGEVKKEEALEF